MVQNQARPSSMAGPFPRAAAPQLSAPRQPLQYWAQLLRMHPGGANAAYVGKPAFLIDDKEPVRERIVSSHGRVRHIVDQDGDLPGKGRSESAGIMLPRLKAPCRRQANRIHPLRRLHPVDRRMGLLGIDEERRDAPPKWLYSSFDRTDRISEVRSGIAPEEQHNRVSSEIRQMHGPGFFERDKAEVRRRLADLQSPQVLRGFAAMLDRNGAANARIGSRKRSQAPYAERYGGEAHESEDRPKGGRAELHGASRALLFDG